MTEQELKATVVKEVIVITKQEFQTKVSSFVTAIEDEANVFECALSRDLWPDTGEDVVQVTCDLLLDNGGSMIPTFCGFTSRGGSILDKEGKELPESKIRVVLPKSQGRSIQVHITPLVVLTTSGKIGLG